MIDSGQLSGKILSEKHSCCTFHKFENWCSFCQNQTTIRILFSKVSFKIRYFIIFLFYAIKNRNLVVEKLKLSTAVYKLLFYNSLL